MNPFETEALILSFQVALWAVAVSLPAAIVTGWLLARVDFRGKWIVNGLIHFPLVTPPVVVGYLLLVLLGKNGPLGAFLYNVFGITLAFNWKGAAVASAVMAFPLMVRPVRMALESVDKRLEDAARTLGASSREVFMTVTFPLILPGIITGSLLAFARSLGEFGATITFVSNIPGQTQTLPIALYSVTQMPGGEAGAARLIAISLVLALTALTVSEFFNKKAMEYAGVRHD